MANTRYIVALDQGTTSSRTVVFSADGREVSNASVALPVQFPADGWVEQNPAQIWGTQLSSLQQATANIDPKAIAAIGVTNQRETTIAWDRTTGEPLAPAIVWQCRRSAPIVARLKSLGLEPDIKERTGLVLDAYFSATKIAWLFENVPGLREKTKSGEACFGTVDAFLMFRLSGGRDFVTEPTNASRTMLMDLQKGAWDPSLLKQFGLEEKNLPRIVPSAGIMTSTSILGPEIPVTGCLGDQQASLFGHGCTEPDSVKCTFGTGAFLLLNTGEERKRSSSGLLSTTAWSLLDNGAMRHQFALEGSVFVAGSLVQWFRDKLHFIKNSSETDSLVSSIRSSGGVVVVPALTGLGAPHWNDRARGLIAGITRDTTDAHILRAGLEGVAHTVADLFDCEEFSGVSRLNIDGGMSRSKIFDQLLADILQREIIVAARPETTAFGVAALAAYGAGLYPSANEAIKTFLDADSEKKPSIVTPVMGASEHQAMRSHWKSVLQASLQISGT